MKLNVRSCCFALLFLAMAALSSFGQFEVSPDHFDDNPPAPRNDDHSNSAADLKSQIIQQKALLAGYNQQIQTRTNRVEKARLDFQSSMSAAAKNELVVRQNDLKELRQELAAPMRDCQATLAGLKRKQAVSHADAGGKLKSPGVLAASKR